MELVAGSERIKTRHYCHPALGDVVWRPAKSIWISLMTVIGLFGAPMTFGWSEFFVFLTVTGITLCAGHSVGMHRKLIHNSFQCPRWLEYLLVYLGVLVGMAGPIGMMRQHDVRDWAQRQSACHDYLCHRQRILRDYFWQCHCDLELTFAPTFSPEPSVRRDKFYRWLEATWMAQQAPVAVILFLCGGWSFVVWGVALRVAVSVTGHWLVGYFAHHEFRQPHHRMTWIVSGASVQGRDVPIAGLISMGESWHNNHHAFPGSARIGLYPGQPDPGWWLICSLRRLGLISNVVTPEVMSRRPALRRIPNATTGWRICHLRRNVWKAVFNAT